MEDIFEKIQKIPINDIADKIGIKIKNSYASCFNGHDKKSPSLHFNLKKNEWYCFSCGVGGSNIQLIKEAMQLDLPSALSWFKTHYAGLNATTSKSYIRRTRVHSLGKITLIKKTEPAAFPNPEIYNFLIAACSLSFAGLNYLTQRGYSIDTINSLLVKDIPDPKTVFKVLTDNWSLDDLAKSGLTKYDETNKKYKFVWWNHIILFPFLNNEKNVCYLQGRHLDNNHHPKYINLFGVAKPIYNIQLISALKKGDTIYFFEGITDAMMGIQNNLNSFGILGASSFQDDYVELFKDYKIRVVQDNDSAGRLFAHTIKQKFETVNKTVQVMDIPFGKDYSEYNLLKLEK